jgi:peptidyl-tRNA hydrolase, PTH1 family
MKILVGLGNPGDKYAGNRHNVGFMALDAIAERYGAPQWRKRFQGLASEVDIGRQRYLLLKPMTYMNESGRAVSEAMRFYKNSPADVVVLHDEIDLEPGKLRVKFGGGHAGHNGLRSISAHIGNDYQRVRIGVGHPGSREAVAHYVLQDFAKADREWLSTLIGAIAQSVTSLVTGQDSKFMNEVARLARPPKTAKPEKAEAAKAPEATPEKPAAAKVPEANPAATQPAPAGVKTPEPVVAQPATGAEKVLEPAGANIAAKTEASAASKPAKNFEPAGAKPAETSLGAKLKAWLRRG